MSEITDGLDLLGDWLDARGYGEEAGLCTRAMDEINKLRAALKPFAECSPIERDDAWFAHEIRIEDFRAAAAALKESE